MNEICLNGRFLSAAMPVFSSANRGYRYGDGLFETMKMVQGRLPLAPLHWKRLFSGLRLLQIHPPFTAEDLQRNVEELCGRNGLATARVRLSIFREGESCSYLIEAMALPAASYQWQDRALTIGIYPFARKAQDAFSNLKSANYLPYVMAERYANEQGWDEALVLNGQSKISDASKANLFLLKDGALHTPAPHQGGVNGVMRLYLIEEAKKLNIEVHQTEISESDLLEGEEAFLTNALYGIRPIGQFRDRTYGYTYSKKLYHQILSTILE